ncbi:MAG TPA: BON domain-containing protein [Rhodocyclaceae bacterium]|nr:BON domain-containing protein [Rhodocyclaceae bacterium]
MLRTTFVALAAATTLLALPGCAVTRDQSTVGEYVDDSAITASVKARLLENKDVDGTSVKVQTLNGEVMLSGFAKSEKERSTAESIARNVKGVKSVKNALVVRTGS